MAPKVETKLSSSEKAAAKKIKAKENKGKLLIPFLLYLSAETWYWILIAFFVFHSQGKS